MSRGNPQTRRAARRSGRGPVEAPSLVPLRCVEIYREVIWGAGDLLRKVLSKKAPARAGESLDLVVLDRQVGTIANGPWRGRRLDEVLRTHAVEVLGQDGAARFAGRFPLAIKFLAVRDRLSLQVHPSDEFAARYERDRTGKMEAWYVLYAEPEVRVPRGILPGVTIAEFRRALEEGRVESVLNVMEVQVGDVIFFPPGTVHSAWGGLVVLEVQQNSDVTYRLTDWGRVGLDGRPRRLDVAKGLAATDFYTMGISRFRPQRMIGYSYPRKLLLKCEKFTMELLELSRTAVTEPAVDDRFRIYAVVRGRGVFRFGPEGRQREPFGPGQVFLMPARLGAHTIAPTGACEIVCVYV